MYRIRHIGTGKYLGVAHDKLELTFKSNPDLFDTIFTIKKESFKQDIGSTSDSISSGSLIILETFYKTYL